VILSRTLTKTLSRGIEQGSHAEPMARPDGHHRRLVEMQSFGLDDDRALASE